MKLPVSKIDRSGLDLLCGGVGCVVAGFEYHAECFDEMVARRVLQLDLRIMVVYDEGVYMMRW